MTTFAPDGSYDMQFAMAFFVVVCTTLAYVGLVTIFDPLGLVWLLVWALALFVGPLLINIPKYLINFLMTFVDNEFFFWTLYLIKFFRSNVFDYAG